MDGALGDHIGDAREVAQERPEAAIRGAEARVRRRVHQLHRVARGSELLESLLDLVGVETVVDQACLHRRTGSVGGAVDQGANPIRVDPPPLGNASDQGGEEVVDQLLELLSMLGRHRLPGKDLGGALEATHSHHLGLHAQAAEQVLHEVALEAQPEQEDGAALGQPEPGRGTRQQHVFAAQGLAVDRDRLSGGAHLLDGAAQRQHPGESTSHPFEANQHPIHPRIDGGVLQHLEQLQEGEGVIATAEERRRQQVLDGRSQADADPHRSPRQRQVADPALDDPHRVGPDPAGDSGDSRLQRCHARRRER